MSLSGSSDSIRHWICSPDISAFFIHTAHIDSKGLLDLCIQLSAIAIVLRMTLEQCSKFWAISRSFARGVKVTFVPSA